MNIFIRFYAYILQLPRIARVYVWYKDLPRAIRTWMIVLACGFFSTTALFFYAAFLFFTQQDITVSASEKADTSFSVEEVRALVQRIENRTEEVIEPLSIDPGP